MRGSSFFILLIICSSFVVAAEQPYVLQITNDLIAGYGLVYDNYDLEIDDSVVCTTTNGLCPPGDPDGTGGWTNTSTQTKTGLIVNITNYLQLNGNRIYLNKSSADGGGIADVSAGSVGTVMYGYLDKFTFYNQNGSTIMTSMAPSSIYGSNAAGGDFTIYSTSSGTLGDLFLSADNVVVGTDKTLPAWHDFQAGFPENGNQLADSAKIAIYDTYATTTMKPILLLNRVGANGVVYPASAEFYLGQHTNDYHPNSKLDIRLKNDDSWNESATTNVMSLYSTGLVNITGNLVVTGNVSFKRPYGMYSDVTNQTLAATGTAYPVNFSTTEDSYLITKSANNQNFTFSQSGDYLIEISALAKSSTPGTRVEIWIEKNGVNVARSNTVYDFKSTNAYAVISIPFILDMNPGDHFRVMWAGSNTGITLAEVGATSYSPQTPSIIMTISKISEITE